MPSQSPIPKLSLAEIAKRTGLYKSTVLRLIKSLEKFGYMHRSNDGAYQLGSKTLFLGRCTSATSVPADVVPAVLRQVVDQLGGRCSLYVRDGDYRVCLHRIDSTHAVRYAVHEGDRLPLTVGASSHVIRAFDGAVGARYEQIRRDMYSASYGERDPETAAVACPVFGTAQNPGRGAHHLGTEVSDRIARSRAHPPGAVQARHRFDAHHGWGH